jgi:hypothetical protein
MELAYINILLSSIPKGFSQEMTTFYMWIFPPVHVDIIALYGQWKELECSTFTSGDALFTVLHTQLNLTRVFENIELFLDRIIGTMY